MFSAFNVFRTETKALIQIYGKTNPIMGYLWKKGLTVSRYF